MTRREFCEFVGIGFAGLAGAFLGQSCPAERGPKPMTTAPPLEPKYEIWYRPPLYTKITISAADIEASRHSSGAFVKAFAQERQSAYTAVFAGGYAHAGRRRSAHRHR